jgi:hypothetical protein
MGLQDYKIPEEKPRRGLWPLYGLLMALAVGAISYVLAPELLRFVRSRSQDFNIGNLTEEQVILLFAGVIFLVLMAIATLILAFAAPKKKSQVKDASLVKEKKLMEAERRARKKRQLEIQRKLREQNRRVD